MVSGFSKKYSNKIQAIFSFTFSNSYSISGSKSKHLLSSLVPVTSQANESFNIVYAFIKKSISFNRSKPFFLKDDLRHNKLFSILEIYIYFIVSIWDYLYYFWKHIHPPLILNQWIDSIYVKPHTTEVA